MKPFLSRPNLEETIPAVISSRADSSSALYVGVSQCPPNCLQLVQNTAAHLLTDTPRREHVCPVLHTLHRLPVRLRIHLNLLMFVFKALHGLAPAYLPDFRSVVSKAGLLGHLANFCQKSRGQGGSVGVSGLYLLLRPDPPTSSPRFTPCH